MDGWSILATENEDLMKARQGIGTVSIEHRSDRIHPVHHFFIFIDYPAIRGTNVVR